METLVVLLIAMVAYQEWRLRRLYEGLAWVFTHVRIVNPSSNDEQALERVCKSLGINIPGKDGDNI